MSALQQVAPLLRCPICQAGLALDDRRLACARGHSYDIARQGYVNLSTGRGDPGTGDTAAMVAARARFLARGHFAAIAEQVASTAAAAGLVVDLAGGTGYYLSSVLDRGPATTGLCIDVSAPALRRAGRAHPRAAAIGADAWQDLPLVSGAATTVLSIFGPRNPAEIERILGPAGRLIVVAPTPRHLAELAGPVGMIGIDPRKSERQAATFDRFRAVGTEFISYPRALPHADAAAAVGMGPTASHVDAAAIAGRVAALPDPVLVTVAVEVTTYVR